MELSPYYLKRVPETGSWLPEEYRFHTRRHPCLHFVDVPMSLIGAFILVKMKAPGSELLPIAVRVERRIAFKGRDELTAERTSRRNVNHDGC